MKKKSIVLFLICIILLSLACGCAQKSEKQTEYIGIISAMDNEIDILLDKAEIDRVDMVADMEYHVGKLRGVPVIISRAGIGKINAATGITTMLNNYPIAKVIFTGIAGGIADETKVLDEVIATNLVEHDYGILSNDAFTWRSGDPGFGNETGVYYDCDNQLVELAYNSAVEVLGENHVFKGTVASGDQFVSSSEYVKKLKDDYNAYACEMEGVAIAVVCTKYKKPFVVLRTLSDKADGNAHESYENFGDHAGDNSSRIVLKMFESLKKTNLNQN